MKKLGTILLISALLGSLSFSSQAQDTKSVKFTHGLEWGGSFIYYVNSYMLYLTLDRYLAERNTDNWDTHLNGFLNYHAGISVRRFEILLYSGLQGFNKDIREIPVGIKADVLIHKDLLGIFAYTDGCVGIPISKEDKAAPYASLGIGYRLKISNSIRLDYMLGFFTSWTHPKEVFDSYSGVYVTNENIRQSKETVYGIRFSTALKF